MEQYTPSQHPRTFAPAMASWSVKGGSVSVLLSNLSVIISVVILGIVLR